MKNNVMRKENTTTTEKKPVSTTPNKQRRNREYETPSQQRNRDGIGRGPSGSDGSSNMGRGSNH